MGYYTDAEGESSCTACGAGSECDGGESETACSAGSYAAAQSLFCLVCGAGTVCAEGDSSETVCGAGTWSTGDMSNCESCPSGFFCPSVNQPAYACPPGYFATAGSASCTKATAASYVDVYPDEDQTSCTSGEVSFDGMPFCFPCPKGYSCPDSDANNISRCALGEAHDSATTCAA